MKSRYYTYYVRMYTRIETFGYRLYNELSLFV